MKAKDEKKKLTESDIDERVIAEADDENAWFENVPSEAVGKNFLRRYKSANVDPDKMIASTKTQ